jgi:ABC-type antimicrobial peptide transport system permease subunit
MFLAVKTAQDAARATSLVREALATVDSSQPFSDVITMDQRLGRSVSRARTSLMLAGVLALLALALGLIGVYGVLSFGVAQRLREFGVRMALGASTAAVRGMVLKEGLTLTLVGAGLGLVGAMFLVQFMRTTLYGTAVTDLRPYALGLCVVLVSSAVAFWLPARRASDTELSIILRTD